jgi:uncharacterized membrane protein
MIGVINTNILLDAFGKAHPAVSHFPIALLIAALIAELIACWRANLYFHSASKYCLFAGTLGAIFATLSGFPFERIMFLSFQPPLLQHHRIWAYSVASLAVITCIFLFSCGTLIVSTRKFRMIYVFLLIILSILIIITGHTGGMLVYGEDFFDLQLVSSILPSV